MKSVHGKEFMEAIRNKEIDVDPETGAVYRFSKYGKKYKVGNRNAISGYVVVGFGPEGNRINMVAHRIVWMYCYGEIAEGLIINHKNGIKHDNRIDNLEITTPSGNISHSINVLGNTNGKKQDGEMNNMSKLTESDVRNIRSLRAEGKYTYKQIRDILKLDVRPSQIGRICTGDRWSSIT